MRNPPTPSRYRRCYSHPTLITPKLLNPSQALSFTSLLQSSIKLAFPKHYEMGGLSFTRNGRQTKLSYWIHLINVPPFLEFRSIDGILVHLIRSWLQEAQKIKTRGNSTIFDALDIFFVKDKIWLREQHCVCVCVFGMRFNLLELLSKVSYNTLSFLFNCSQAWLGDSKFCIFVWTIINQHNSYLLNQ